jgi:hypothetical protein
MGSLEFDDATFKFEQLYYFDFDFFGKTVSWCQV